MGIRLESVHPVLMSSEVRASLKFYARLGFSVTFQDDPEAPRYGCVQRDGVELHFQWQDPSQWAYPIDRPTYRFLVAEVDALYREWKDGGALPPLADEGSPWQAPGDTPWGTREFHLRDPDGNGLQFYRPL